MVVLYICTVIQSLNVINVLQKKKLVVLNSTPLSVMSYPGTAKHLYKRAAVEFKSNSPLFFSR